jgi:hypothetical protein
MLERLLIRLGAAVLVAMVLSACSTRGVAIEEASITADGRTLELIVGSCNADLSVDVDESPSRVTVTVTARNDTSDDCLDGVTEQLRRPLGERSLVDGVTGDTVPVQYSAP